MLARLLKFCCLTFLVNSAEILDFSQHERVFSVFDFTELDLSGVEAFLTVQGFTNDQISALEKEFHYRRGWIGALL